MTENCYSRFKFIYCKMKNVQGNEGFLQVLQISMLNALLSLYLLLIHQSIMLNRRERIIEPMQ